MNRIPTVSAPFVLALTLLAHALLGTPLAAQDDDARFNAQQADRMHAVAKAAFKKGFPRQARLIWLQLLKLYDPNHADAHKAIGHVKVGKAWNPDPNFDYPITDTGSAADGRSLYKRYESLKKQLASAHRRQAQIWEKAGRKDKSNYHYKMVLRWVKSDAKAQAALHHKAIGEISGTDLEQIVYDRSKMIEAAVVEQTKIKYPSKLVPDGKHPVLEKAGVKYITVKSEHFILHGDHEQKIMQEALEWAERTVRVVQKAFPKDGGFNTDPRRWLREWGFFVEKDTYKQILKANADLVSNLEWSLEYTTSTTLISSQSAIRVGATGNNKVLFDACVRRVAASYSGFRSDGLAEGIGHTFVGMMFNNNRLFAVDLKTQQGTRASEEDREYTSPNFDVWKDLALEQAWKLTGGVKASMLPLIKAATFTNEQRIKAWSFCDYVMRRDPKLLLDMDRLQSQKNTWDIEAAFKEKHDVTIPELDKEWEDFWTGASPALKAIRNNTPPLAAVSKNVQKWLKAFNEARKAQNTTTVRWSANYSVRCKEHVDYLIANKKERGPDKVQQQDPALEGGSHLGNMFAQMALVETHASVGKAKKIFKKWMGIPGYRDALVHGFILTIGLYEDRGILVMNVVSGLGVPKGKRFYTCYPRNGAQGIPSEVKVADLGPELKELLEKNGHGNLKVIGYPLTVHFGHNVQGNRSSYRCRVTDREGEVKGLLLLDNGKNRHTRAPGMVTYYPLKPLKGEISVLWSWTRDDGSQKYPSTFTAN
jgi:hypothetical protein